MHRIPSVVAVRLLLVTVVLSSPAFAQEMIALNPTTDSHTNILGFDVGAPGAVTDFGSSPLPALSGMDVQPGTGRVFVSGGNTDGGRLHRLIPGTNIVTLVGPTGFPNVPGLAFDPGGALFGAARVTGPSLNADGLISIDPTTGAGTLVGDFGMQLGKVVRGVNCLAVHPQSHVMYGIANTAFNGDNGDVFTIDQATGVATHVGTLTDAMGAHVPATIAGLAFDGDGDLFGSFGGGDGRIVSIELSTMTFTILGDPAGGSISDIAFRPRSVMIGLNPVTDSDTNLVAVQTEPFTRADLGAFGMPSLSGLDHQPATGVLFASGGNTDGGNLYTIDTETASAGLVGPTGFPNVPGLAFGLDGKLFGAAHVSGPTLNANGLILIDCITGTATAIGPFGSFAGFEIRGMNALAVEPHTGRLIGSTNAAYDGTTGEMWEIDTATGAAMPLGALVEATTGNPPTATVAGLTFDETGQLFASFGGGDGRIAAVDLATVTFTIIGQASQSGSISDISIFDTPALSVGFAKPNAAGTAPMLSALGGLAPGQTTLFRLDSAAPSSIAVLVLGTGFAQQPFLGGTLIPDPATFSAVFFTGTTGRVDVSLSGGLAPTGFLFAMQYLVVDQNATFATTLSNALLVLFP